MRRLSRELISALRLSFEAGDVAARLAACIALRWRWNCFAGSHPEMGQSRHPDHAPVTSGLAREQTFLEPCGMSQRCGFC